MNKTLSDRIIKQEWTDYDNGDIITVEAVKSFIEQLKEKKFSNGCKCTYCKSFRGKDVIDWNDIIKLAGDKLI